MNRADELFERIQRGGEGAIDELIFSRQSEELFLDFKRSADDGKGSRLHETDSKNFGKAISGFGNSEGGIIVWGIQCSGSNGRVDVASEKNPLADAAAFVSRLEGVISRSTVPVHPLVRSVAIPIDGGPKGFVVSLIPKSYAAPHQTVSGMRFYMRAGSDFVHVPHGILAGMFGRRPEPNVQIVRVIGFPEIHGDEISFDVGIAVRNRGPGIARDTFLTVSCSSMPCKVGSLAFQSNDLKNWIAVASFGTHMSYLSSPTVRIAPDSQLLPVSLHFKFMPPFSGPMTLKITAGCEGGMPDHLNFETSSEIIDEAYRRVVEARAAHQPIDDLLSAFAASVLQR